MTPLDLRQHSEAWHRASKKIREDSEDLGPDLAILMLILASFSMSMANAYLELASKATVDFYKTPTSEG